MSFVLFLDEFEALCGNPTKGFKSVDTHTGPRVQGTHRVVLMLVGFYCQSLKCTPMILYPRDLDTRS